MSQLRYRPDVDGLRAIAVVAVLLYHAFPALLPGGFVGVDVFFVISGYLISGIILDARLGRRFTFANFYARRARRIFPALAVVLGAVLAVGWFRFYADDYARLGRHAAAGAGFIANFVSWRESSYFDVAADLKPLLHLWSLGVEEQFYFVWPMILVIASRWRRGPIVATVFIGALSLAIAIATVRIDRTAAFFAPWTRFWELLAGALLACVERDAALDAWLQRLQSRAAMRNIEALLGVAAVVAGLVLIDSSRVFPGLWALLPVIGTVLLIVSGPTAFINRTLLSAPIVVSIGLISYPLYLWHWPLLSFAHILGGRAPSSAFTVLLLAASVVLATLTYQFIEKPIRFGVRRRLTIPTLASAMAAICVAGLVIVNANGVIDRPINRSDAARLVDYYERMHNGGLARAYRSECDFMDWTSPRVKTAIDPQCTVAGPAHTVFLWGDSYAQALSLGLRDSLPDGTMLAQVTTSACKPQFENFDLSVKDRRCEITNVYAMDAIRRLRPDVVVLAQDDDHAGTDWVALASRALALGAKRVVVVGPTPVWRPTLPRVYAEHHLDDRDAYVGEGLELSRFDADRLLSERLKGIEHVTYLSLLEQLCHGRSCLARIDDADAIDLIAVDAGHLTPKGSAYLGRVIWKPLLASWLRRDATK